MSRLKTQSVHKYCSTCQKKTSHYRKSLKCRTCTVNQNYKILDCPKHGKVKHARKACLTCRNENTLTQQICNVHGLTSFQGQNCCKCILEERVDWTKKYCENCQKVDTHQNGTCMGCNRGGFATGEYANKKECIWKNFEGCEKNLTLIVEHK